MVRIEDIRFIGATLWTELELKLEAKAGEAGAHRRVSRGISDFRGAILHRGRPFATGESVRRHRADRSYIERELDRASRAGERAVVITHHAPSARSIRPRLKGDPLNPAFASNLDRLLARHQPPLWVHGHVHNPVDERLGANPVGYRQENKRGCNPALCIELHGAES